MRQIGYGWLWLLLLPLGGLHAQSTMRQANRALEWQQWETAAQLYSKVLRERPKYKIAHERLIECYTHLDQWYELARAYALFAEQTRRPSAAFARGYVQAFQLNNRHDEARDWLRDYLKAQDPDTTQLHLWRLYADCSNDSLDRYLYLAGENWTVEVLPTSTASDEYAPHWVDADQTLTYTIGSTGKAHQWYAPVYNRYRLAFKRTAFIGTTFAAKAKKHNPQRPNDNTQSIAMHPTAPSVAAAYARKRCGKRIPHQIPFQLAYYDGTIWQPHPISSHDYTTTHPCWDTAGLYLYFASDMPGGYGGMDLYRIPWRDTTWGDVENLGPAINTPYDEVFPFVHPRTGELYFASDGHGGLGGFDIWQAQPYPDDVNWALHRLKAPFNSPQNDYNFYYHSALDITLISSDRRGAGNGVDLFYLKPLLD